MSEDKKQKKLEKPLEKSIADTEIKDVNKKDDKLDQETKKLREAVLKVIAKYPDKEVSTSLEETITNKGIKNKSNKSGYRHKDVATLDIDADASVFDKLLAKKSAKVRIKEESKLGSQIKNLNSLLLKKNKTVEHVKEIIEDVKTEKFHDKKSEEDIIGKKELKEIEAKIKEPKDPESKTKKKAESSKNNDVKKKYFSLDKSGLLIFSLNLGITIVLLGGIMLAVVGIGIYRSSFISNNATSGIVSVIPYPAGIVNSKVLTIADLRRDVAALNRYFSVQSKEDEFYGNFPDGDDVQSIVWDRFVQDTLLFQLANQYGLEITDAMLQEQLDAIVEESGSQVNFENRIAVLYGWDTKTFTERVIKPFVLREVLAAKIFRDKDLRSTRIELINKISTELRDNPDIFSNLAIQYSEDKLTKEVGGETGLLSIGSFGPKLNTAISSLDVDEISGVIESGEGYEIIQILEKTSTEVNIRRILIRYPTLELLLDKAREKATIYRFVR